MGFLVCRSAGVLLHVPQPEPHPSRGPASLVLTGRQGSPPPSSLHLLKGHLQAATQHLSLGDHPLPCFSSQSYQCHSCSMCVHLFISAPH